MRFQDMPYERIDFAKVQEEMGELIRELDAAKSGEEQFEVHQKYYALTDKGRETLSELIAFWNEYTACVDTFIRQCLPKEAKK